jgi:hypothetical protein
MERRADPMTANQINILARGVTPPWEDEPPPGDPAPTPDDGLVEQAWRIVERMNAEQRRALLAKLQEGRPRR